MKKKVVKKNKKVTPKKTKRIVSSKVKKIEVIAILKSLGLFTEPKPKLRDFWGLFPKVKNHCFEDMMGETNYLDEFQELVETMPEDQFNSLIWIEKSYSGKDNISLNDFNLRKLRLNKYKQEFKHLFKLINLEKNGRPVNKNWSSTVKVEPVAESEDEKADSKMKDINNLVSLINSGANELANKIEVEKNLPKLVEPQSIDKLHKLMQNTQQPKDNIEIFKKYTKPSLYVKVNQQILLYKIKLMMYAFMLVVTPIKKVMNLGKAWNQKFQVWLDNKRPSKQLEAEKDLAHALNKICKLMAKQSKELAAHHEKEASNFSSKYHTREASSFCNGSFRRSN